LENAQCVNLSFVRDQLNEQKKKDTPTVTVIETTNKQTVTKNEKLRYFTFLSRQLFNQAEFN